jgi:oligopeptide/dipeptide ABC transporter ATP-binding protein
MTVFSIRDLSVNFETERGIVHALRDVSLTVPQGQIVGIVGESGSGKSTLALAIMGLLPANAVIVSGRIDFHGTDLAALPTETWRSIRGERISMVFQDPMTSLNPVRSIGAQMSDIQFRETDSINKRERAMAALKHVGIPDAEAQLGRYPFQFSGGMRQRIAIAMSLLQKPELLIADEVTTALDVTLEAQILHLLRELRAEINGSILFISHNLGAVAEICDCVVVLYAGEVVEAGPVDEIYHRPRHPYTQALLACDPARIARATRELPVIPGDVPNLLRPPDACIFASRCPHVFDRCREERPRDRMIAVSHHARCHLAERVSA